MVTLVGLESAILLLFVLNSATGDQSCDTGGLNDRQCPSTLTCVPKNGLIGYCDCFPGYTKVNDTFCKKSGNYSTVKSSSLVEEKSTTSGHVVAGIVIPIVLIMVVISGAYFNRKYHLVDYISSKLYQRNNNYDEVMIGQDLEDDDPPLH
ncbi:hypothetical protein FQA39_LY10698 [Lamprigera yunnana]|nr:hypothetical protein FQA39_LY10698 [Lamprigera yunnana]